MTEDVLEERFHVCFERAKLQDILFRAFRCIRNVLRPCRGFKSQFDRVFLVLLNALCTGKSEVRKPVYRDGGPIKTYLRIFQDFLRNLERTLHSRAKHRHCLGDRYKYVERRDRELELIRRHV
jgi:hypothetical protein